jgi:CRISPR/Cas system CSM-associated protein Csm3 (group 7 of RAMP superfamily)
LFGNRIKITIPLVTETPLHCGTGDSEELTIATSNTPIRYANIVRGANRRAFLPAPTVKGAIRAAYLRAFPDKTKAAAALFGDNAEVETDFRMGRMILFGAEADEGSTNAALPYAARLDKAGAYLAAHTAIDGGIGVADDHKLYHQELLAAGARFTLQALVLANAQGDLFGEAEQALALVTRDGLRIGKGRADGQGLLAVAGSIEAVAHEIDANGTLSPTWRKTIAPAADDDGRSAVIRHCSIALFCPGPFLVADSGAVAGRDTRNPDRDKQNTEAQVQAQKSSDSQPLLPGSSVSGALRQRARFLWRREYLRNNEQFEADTDPAPVIELFGDTSQMARLHVTRCVISEGEPFEITSVKLDHFTGGPVDNALFRTAAFVGTRLDLELTLIERPKTETSIEAIALFELLHKDVRDNGITLGAGGNKGFGWFEPLEGQG